MKRKKRKRSKDVREFASADDITEALSSGTAYIAATWPDYTTDAGRAMELELPPMPENMDDYKNRLAWLALSLGEAAKYARPEPRKRKPIRHPADCQHCGDPLANPSQQRGFCSDRCVLLDRYERRRGG